MQRVVWGCWAWTCSGVCDSSETWAVRGSCCHTAIQGPTAPCSAHWQSTHCRYCPMFYTMQVLPHVLHTAGTAPCCAHCKYCPMFYTLQVLLLVLHTAGMAPCSAHCRYCSMFCRLQVLLHVLQTTGTAPCSTHYRYCSMFYPLHVLLHVPHTARVYTS